MSDSEGETVELLSVVSAGADPHDFSVSFAKQNGAVAEDHDHDESVSSPTQDDHTSDSTALIATAELASKEGEEEEEEEGGGAPPTEPASKHTSSIGGASFNFINSIIGAGIIGIPLALQESGLLTGLLLLVVVAFVTDYTVLLLIKDGILAGKSSYQEMVIAAFGRVGYVILTLSQFFFPFFAMSGYVVIVGDSYTQIIRVIFDAANAPIIPVLVDHRMIKVIMVLLVMLPVSLLRNISTLEKFSAFAIVCIVFMVTVTVYKATELFCAVRCFSPQCCDTVVTSWVINKDVFQAVGILAFAFVCHHNTFLIYASLKDKSLSRFSIVSHVSVFISFVFCFVLGLTGFVTFMNDTQGDLLNNYCKDPVSTATRFFFACVIMLTYPIECFVAREVLEISLSSVPYKAISWIPHITTRRVFDRFLYTPRHKSLSRHIILTLFIVVSTLAIGISTQDLGVVLAFTGCLTAVPLAFVLPTASFLKLSKRRWISLPKIGAIIVLVFGVLVMVIGTALAIKGAVESYIHSEEVYARAYCTQGQDPFVTCCKVVESTKNFTISIANCDCQQFCTNSTILDETRLIIMLWEWFRSEPRSRKTSSFPDNLVRIYSSSI